MDKEELKIKLDALEANVEARRDELMFATSAVDHAKKEISNAGKPVVSQSTVDDLVEQLTEMFSDIVSEIDVSELNAEFGINGCEIYLEHLNTSDIVVSDHDIQNVLEDFFAIEEDEDDDTTV